MSPVLLAVFACSGPVVPALDQPAEDLSEAVYDLDHLLRVEIELPEDDWDELRQETRTLESTIMAEDCQAQPFENPFSWFEASVTLDGETIERVDVRKKGFLGSLSDVKPSLKLDLGEYDAEATFNSVRRLTLNNAVSDPSYVRQCISYSFFTDASMPAPRCSLAQVTVNGEDLGIYVNVEPIKEPMLARHFDESEGNLYEGTLSDFREGWTGTLEKKTNEGEDDWDDIDALVEAVATDDDELLSALETVLDLESFIDFWAAEVLVEHGDGYNGNTNNFYLYADPSDGRFRFIPWGTDAVFYGGGEGSEGTSVYASSMLAWRLYRHPDGQALYVERLQDMLDTHWDEGIAAERIDRMATLIEPEVSGSTWSEIEEAQEVVFDQIEARRPDIEAALADGPPEWPYEPRDSYCFVPSGSIEATFSTTWGTLQTGDPWQTGSSTLSMVFEEPMPEVEGTAVAGTSEGSALIYLPAWISDTEAVLVYFAMEEEQVAPGDVDLDLDRAIGALLYIDTETMDDFEFVAYVIGDLHFDAADSTTDAPIEGSLSGEFLAF